MEVSADAPIKLDGKLDEAVWAEAKPTAMFVNTMTGDAADFKVSAKAAWDAKNLYVAFDVADDYLKSTFTKDDEHLWEQDAIEIMIDPDGDEKNYFELQVSPAGKVFDTRYDSRRVPTALRAHGLQLRTQERRRSARQAQRRRCRRGLHGGDRDPLDARSRWAIPSTSHPRPAIPGA